MTQAMGRWREPVMPDLPVSAALVGWARNRPAGARTELPRVGEVVGLRVQAYGPVVRAQVLAVSMDRPADTRPGTEIDWNVWRYTVRGPGLGPSTDAFGNYEIELVEDPWPDVLVRTLDGPALRTQTREARIPGSPGWLRGKE